MEGQKIWNYILSVIKQRVSLSTYRTWFAGSSVLEFKKTAKGDLLIVAFKNSFLREQVEARYSPLISEVANKQNRSPIKVVLVVSQENLQEVVKNDPIFSGTPKSYIANWPKAEALNPNHSFDNFVVGASNNLAYLAAKNVADNLGVTYNPFLVYGPTGVGKTHLLQAIGNAALGTVTETKVVYVSSEKFTNDFIESLRNKTQPAFRQKYRKIDLLLIDDIQFLSGKESTQDEFFFTFNELMLTGRQVVIASDQHPKELGRLKERLIGRFLAGMAADIGIPDLEMKVAILKSKCQMRGLALDDEATNFIAETCPGGARELEGLIVTLLAKISLSGGISFNEIREAIENNRAASAINLTHGVIINAVSEHFKISAQDLCGGSRKQRLVLPRQILMYLLRKELKLPLEQIGEILGGRDHSTILYGIEKVQKTIEENRLAYDEILRVESLFHRYKARYPQKPTVF